MIARAPYSEKFSSARERVFQVLSDLKWHSWRELCRVGGIRYGARVAELRRLGFRIASGTQSDGIGKAYRLTSVEVGEPIVKKVKVYLDEKDAVFVALLVGARGPKSAQTALRRALASHSANGACL